MIIALLAGQNSIHTVRWANALVKRCHVVHLITQHGAEDLIDSNVKIHQLNFKFQFGYILNAQYLVNLLKDIKPDLLHVHYASGYGTLGSLSHFHPRILSVWGSDVYDFPKKSLFHKWLVAHNIKSADWLCSTSYVMAKQTQEICPTLKNISVTPFGIDTSLFKPQLSKKKIKMIKQLQLAPLNA